MYWHFRPLSNLICPTPCPVIATLHNNPSFYSPHTFPPFVWHYLLWWVVSHSPAYGQGVPGSQSVVQKYAPTEGLSTQFLMCCENIGPLPFHVNPCNQKSQKMKHVCLKEFVMCKSLLARNCSITMFFPALPYSQNKFLQCPGLLSVPLSIQLSSLLVILDKGHLEESLTLRNANALLYRKTDSCGAKGHSKSLSLFAFCSAGKKRCAGFFLELY